MSIQRRRAASLIRRTISGRAAPHAGTAASLGAAGYSDVFVIAVPVDPDAAALDMRAVASGGLWTEDDDWSLQWWWIATGGLFES